MERVKYVQRATNKDIDSYVTNYKLTKLQTDILASRVDEEVLKEFDYDIKDLVNSKFDPMKNIYKLPDIEKAGELIANAIKDKKHIVIVNDFDADGITSGAVLYKAFEKVLHVHKDNFGIIVNKRSTGTGYSKTLVSRIIDYHENIHKIDMIVSSDHGSTCELAYRELKEAGIGDLIITDHHTVEYDIYPDSASAFVNPQRKDSTYYKEVSGCFIAYIVMVMTYVKLHKVYREEHFNILLPYVALSTVTDVMSLKYPINRQVVKVGLNIMNGYRYPLWVVLKKLLNLNNRLTSYDLGFKLGPLINTANRMDVEEVVMLGMIDNNYDDIFKHFKILLDMSVIKKAAQAEGSKLAEEQIRNNVYKNSNVICIKSEYAINGIIAGMVGGRHNKPTVCFIESDSEALMGSGRGIRSDVDLVSIYKIIDKRDKSIFLGFGGHKLAAGCAIHKDKLEEFKKQFDKEVVKQIGKVSSSNILTYDSKLKLEDITLSTAKEITRLSPYGKDWVEPLFMTECIVDNILVFGTISKIFFKSSNGHKNSGITFFNNQMTGINHSNIKTMINRGDKVIITYTLGVSTNRNVVGVNMIINTIERKA